jgi:8-amino-7-oxononanoate synthase
VGSSLQSWAEAQLGELASAGLTRELEPLESPQGPTVRVGGQTLLNFSSNDYLGLAAEPAVLQAAHAVLERQGLGSGASRLVAGDSTWHQALEHDLARFLKTDAALLFNSGYAANLGLLSGLWGTGDTLFSDELNHASLIDGARLSRARIVVYPHRDVATLATLLAEPATGRRAVITDSVFSMEGDLAPLVDLWALCQRTDTALVVDEAHATGLFGPTGAGLCEQVGVNPDVRMGTLGKALGGFGAFVACAAPIQKLLLHRARSLVFSTALPAAWCAAASAALMHLKNNPAVRARLWRNIEVFAQGLNRCELAAEPRSPIFSVVLGAPERALQAAAFLRVRGLWARPIRPPTVPKGSSRLRLTVRADHSPQHLVQALDALAAWQRESAR